MRIHSELKTFTYIQGQTAQMSVVCKRQHVTQMSFISKTQTLGFKVPPWQALRIANLRVLMWGAPRRSSGVPVCGVETPGDGLFLAGVTGTLLSSSIWSSSRLLSSRSTSKSIAFSWQKETHACMPYFCSTISQQSRSSMPPILPFVSLASWQSWLSSMQACN